MTAIRVLVGVPLVVAAVLLGVALAMAQHGQILGAGLAAMASVASAFIAGVFVGDLT